MNKPKYKNADDMAKNADEYFRACKGHTVTDENGDVVCDKNGIPVIVDARPPTVTGLALALGFNSRQSLLNYKARSKAFDDVITRAKSRCEEYTETRLFDRDGVNGAKFSLVNNFKGWNGQNGETAESLQRLDEILNKIT